MQCAAKTAADRRGIGQRGFGDRGEIRGKQHVGQGEACEIGGDHAGNFSFTDFRHTIRGRHGTPPTLRDRITRLERRGKVCCHQVL
jgi:hypothetical protein